MIRGLNGRLEHFKAAMDMNDAQARQAQLMLEAAPLIGKSAKDLAQAQVAAGGNKIV